METATSDVLLYRRVERANGEEWATISFSELRCGDRFRLYDPEDANTRIEDGSRVYTASSDAKPYPHYGVNNYVIEIEDTVAQTTLETQAAQ